MSDQERHQIIGRLISDRARAKEEIELIRADMYSKGQILFRIGERLEKYAIDDAARTFREHKARFSGDLDKLAERFTEYEQLNERIQNLEQQLRALGIKA